MNIKVDKMYGGQYSIQIEDDLDLVETSKQHRETLYQLADIYLNLLTPREWKVLHDRRTGNNKTLEKVGQDLGVTRERVRQIEAKALAKLRHGGFIFAKAYMDYNKKRNELYTREDIRKEMFLAGIEYHRALLKEQENK